MQLPNDIFYNTGIATYVWFVSNAKADNRKGKVQLINASSAAFYRKMRKSLGSKRNELITEHIETIQKVYFDFEENEVSKIFGNTDFGFYQIQVHQPEKDEKGKIILDAKGKMKSDSALKDIENVPMIGRDRACPVSTWNTITVCDEYFKREVLPFAPDAWYDKTKMKVGYEIAFNKYFYKYEGLRPLTDIAADILKLEQETDGLLKEIIE